MPTVLRLASYVLPIVFDKLRYGLPCLIGSSLFPVSQDYILARISSETLAPSYFVLKDFII
nr:MAG TPA: hypothetical protein [Caudoviricetes sp.]